MRQFHYLEPVPVKVHTFKRKGLHRWNPKMERFKAVTIAIAEYNGSLFAGIACCSKKDDYNRNLGTKIAVDRARMAAYKLNYLKDDRLAVTKDKVLNSKGEIKSYQLSCRILEAIDFKKTGKQAKHNTFVFNYWIRSLINPNGLNWVIPVALSI